MFMLWHDLLWFCMGAIGMALVKSWYDDLVIARFLKGVSNPKEEIDEDALKGGR